MAADGASGKRSVGEPQAPSLSAQSLDNGECNPGLPGSQGRVFVKVRGQTFDTEVEDKA